MNKKIFRITLLFLILLECSCVFLMYKSFSNRNIVATNEIQEVNRKMFAMYTEQDDGSYTEYTDSNYFPSNGYKINLDKSNCVDNKGNSIEEVITSNSNKITVSSNKTTYCYLYFDIDKSVYAKVMSDYTNSNGVLLLSETENDEYPVYYYSGNITNNNILYGNFCWKMVRTTETGGVKLIYNGVPDESEDGTLTCDNTGEESQIGTSAFNSSGSSLAYVGYMYNEIYSSQSRSKYVRNIMSWQYSPGEYYYADTATWNGSKYVLSNSDGSEVITYVMADSYNDLVGKYTCLSTTEIECAVVSHVTGYTTAEGGRMFFYKMSAGTDYDDYKIKLATSVTDNGDGTYSLIEPINVTYIDWYKNYSNYKNYYSCSDLTSETCDYIVAVIPSSISLTGWNIIPYKYGTSVKYEDGVYKLTDSIDFWNWADDYSQINNHHYTCLNVNDKCESVNYVYYFNGSSTFYYLTLSDGEFVEDAINKMLYADDVNKTDSTIKDYIDTWYEDNILNVLDSNSVLYSTYLEDTIFCNNREITDLGGWNPDGGNIKTNLRFDSSAFECNNKTDQFTLKVEAGGIKGYGNNALDYPIALLSSKEINIALTTGYLKSGENYFSISPSTFAGGNLLIMQYWYGGFQSYYGTNSLGVRPAVSLANKVEITEGDGSVSAPYQVILPS